MPFYLKFHFFQVKKKQVFFLVWILNCFLGLTEGERHDFGTQLKEKSFTKGQKMIKEGDKGTEFYIIVKVWFIFAKKSFFFCVSVVFCFL